MTPAILGELGEKLERIPFRIYSLIYFSDVEMHA
jgi:hypothetical protein